jgi:hypothetical protein
MLDRNRRSFRFARWLSALLAVSAVLLMLPGSVFAQAPGGRVLILEPTVTGGAASIEATTAASLGFAVDVVSPTTWSTLTAADFARYRAIILGDPTCQTSTSAIAAAEANASVWGPVVTGNVVIIATDATYHATVGADPPAGTLIRNAVAHATALSGTTGAYISLSCYYVSAAPNTLVPVLTGLSPGGFTIEGTSSDAAHITEPTSPVVAGLTDASLSNWIVSIHEVFDRWPSNFTVVAVDAAQNKPYILTRGPSLPTSKEQCKQGGWRNFGVFRNQGDCVSFVATGGKNPPGGP